MSKETGGPAFPLDYDSAMETAIDGTSMHGAGMTLRDYFAAKAMQQFLAETLYRCRAEKDEGNVKRLFDEIEISAYEIADAMLEARNV